VSQSPQPPEPRSNLLIYLLAGVMMVAILAVGVILLLDLVREPEVIDLTSSDLSGAAQQSADFAGGVPIDPPQELQDFVMTANNGQPLSLSELEGRYVLLYFGYTYCPDACPMTLLKFRQVKSMLGDDADQVAFLFISVDGERDTPELLDRYLERYDPDFIGLSGDDEELDRIAPDYNLYYQRREHASSQAGYLVDHTSSKFLIDPQGRLIRIYSFTTGPEIIASEIRALLGTQRLGALGRMLHVTS
jgi:protein SCO1